MNISISAAQNLKMRRLAMLTPNFLKTVLEPSEARTRHQLGRTLTQSCIPSFLEDQIKASMIIQCF